MGFEQYKDVWVFIECFEGTPKNVGLELLGQGRKLAEGLGQVQHMVGDTQLAGSLGGLLPTALAAGKQNHGDAGQMISLVLQQPYSGGAVHPSAHGYGSAWMHGSVLLGRKFNQKYIILYSLGQLNARRKGENREGNRSILRNTEGIAHLVQSFGK